MRKVELMTIIGLVAGFSLIIWGIAREGDLRAFMNPAALAITLGGSFGALLISFRLEDIKMVFNVTKQVFVRQDEDVLSLNEKFYFLAQKARREGLLVLEDELDELDDPFFRGGLQMVIDGFEPDNIRHILNTEINSMESRHELGQNIYRTWGTYSPAFGLVGTLIGLISMLAVFQDDPDALGPGMSVALVTTFYGVLFANLIFHPLASKLEIYSSQEIKRKEAIIESLLALQSGINPRLLQEQLKAYLSPAEKEAMEKEKAQEREDEVMLNV